MTTLPFSAFIAAFRDTFRRGRSQTDITAQAVTYKRQLESVGLFPGLMRGTPPKGHAITDRAARKALAREIQKQRWYHLKSGGKLEDFIFHAPTVVEPTGLDFIRDVPPELPADRVEEVSDGFVLVLGGVLQAKTYVARKTANRALRTYMASREVAHAA